MSHRFKKKTPTTVMYRHFAAITLAITVLLAIFADGEKAGAVAGGREAKPLEYQAAKAKAPKPVAPPQETGGVWGVDVGISGLQAPQTTGTVAAYMPAEVRGLAGRYSPEFLARLSPEEREGLLQAMAENGADDPAAGEARTDAVLRDSLRRSGSAGRE
ncbi:hypothetical protein [Tsuneonella sp. HG222]